MPSPFVKSPPCVNHLMILISYLRKCLFDRCQPKKSDIIPLILNAVIPYKTNSILLNNVIIQTSQKPLAFDFVKKYKSYEKAYQWTLSVKLRSIYRSIEPIESIDLWSPRWSKVMKMNLKGTWSKNPGMMKSNENQRKGLSNYQWIKGPQAWILDDENSWKDASNNQWIKERDLEHESWNDAVHWATLITKALFSCRKIYYL